MRGKRWAVSALLVAGLGLGHTVIAEPASAVPGLETVSAVSPLNSNVFRQQAVNCPAGKVVVGGGGRLEGAATEVALTGLTPLASGAGYEARAYEDRDGWAGNWAVRVFAICANPLPGWEINDVTSPVGSPAAMNITANCTPGKRVLGTGGSVFPGRGVVVLTGFIPNGQPAASVTAFGAETQGGYAGGWTVRAWAICANPVPGPGWFAASSPFDSVSPKNATATCPGGSFAHGAGALIGNGAGEVGLTGVSPNAIVPTSINAAAREDQPPGYAGSWSIRSYAICMT